MASNRQYWVVSPNVKFDEKTVQSWKEEIIGNNIAIMGYRPDDPKHAAGLKFAGRYKKGRSIQTGDIILIARSHKKAPDIVGIGVVNRGYRTVRLPPSDDNVYIRDLKPFIAVDRAPNNVPINALVRHHLALAQLHPGDTGKPAHKTVCDWMERKLRETSQKHPGAQNRGGDNGASSSEVTEVELGKKKSGYKIRTKSQVTRSRNIEDKLLEDYKQWLIAKGRAPSALEFGRLRCDCWEKARRNLIEAKASTRREDIRMAVGQLLDYSFRAKTKFKNINLAILLPKEPAPDFVNWLPAGINIIWRKNRRFFDNANGKFI